MGGKSKIADKIAGYLNFLRRPDQPYWEPFVGGAWVLARIRGGPVFASDINAALIAMWRAVQGGWIPPASITEEDYQRARRGEFDAPLTAFIAIACSFGGKWFGGYARSGDRNFAKMGQLSLLRQIAHMEKEIMFFHADFMTCAAPAPACLIYCDPPYAGATNYSAARQFDSAIFWERVRQLENCGHTVVISEYDAPEDFSCVLEMPIKISLRTRSGAAPRVERLFRFGEQPQFQRMLPGFF